jgi:excisionase family DNA binding protein
MTAGESPLFLTVPQVAARIGLGVDQTYRLLKLGKIKAYRVGLNRGRYRVTPAHVEAYLESCETSEAAPTSEPAKPKHVARTGRYVSRHFGPL